MRAATETVRAVGKCVGAVRLPQLRRSAIAGKAPSHALAQFPAQLLVAAATVHSTLGPSLRGRQQLLVEAVEATIDLVAQTLAPVGQSARVGDRHPEARHRATGLVPLGIRARVPQAMHLEHQLD
eukprot:scaffold84739_cov69-Phaeocystis_antarctica.AAC.5